MATTARKRLPPAGPKPVPPARLKTGRVTLERALSKLGLASRTEARVLIEAGRVSIDGRAITSPGHEVVPERAAIAIDGLSHPRAASMTIMLHKPRGYVTTRSDPEGRPTIYDLLADLGTRVVPVGRLDLATSGLLLLTNDTRLADWLTDPQTGVARVYLVTVRGCVTSGTARRLVEGVRSDGEHLSAKEARVRKASKRESHLVVTLIEGKNREIRRLFEAIGHPVSRLRRVLFGGLSLGTLAPGRWREVTRAELDEAFAGRPDRSSIRSSTRGRRSL